jgi:hypothetical protein
MVRQLIFQLLFSPSYQTGLFTVPIVTPPVLVLTKIKRWFTMAESTRPQSVRKAENDIRDINVLLDWLKRIIHIDFEGYPEKPKRDLLPRSPGWR